MNEFEDCNKSCPIDNLRIINLITITPKFYTIMLTFIEPVTFWSNIINISFHTDRLNS